MIFSGSMWNNAKSIRKKFRPDPLLGTRVIAKKHEETERYNGYAIHPYSCVRETHHNDSVAPSSASEV